MTDRYDVIVVGVGAMGAAACFHLARRGLKVLGIERFAIPNNLGSSHGLSRMIRLAYYEHPDYVPLLRRAYDNWREIEQLANRKLLHVTGGIYLGGRDSKVIAGSLESSKTHGLPHESLDAAQMRTRYPQFVVPDDVAAIYEPNAGFLIPELAIDTMAEQAIRFGAKLLPHTRVVDWEERVASVKVRTESAEFEAEHLLLCGGDWNAGLTHGIDLGLTVTRQVLLWMQPSDPTLFEYGQFPVFAVDEPSGGLFYGFPASPRSGEVKVAWHYPGTATDADHVARELLPADVAPVRTFIEKWMPALDGKVTQHRVCLYTNTTDQHFIIDRLPGSERATLCSSCSGHGFKFASVIGEILADLATDGATNWPIEFLSIGRRA